MKFLFSILFFSFFLLNANDLTAQNCAESIYQNGDQVEAIKQVMASQDAWFYGIQLIQKGNETLAKIYNVDGVELNKGDEITFMDLTEKKVSFTFINNPENKDLDGYAYHENYIKLSSRNLNWFTSKTIQKLYIKNKANNQTHKYDVNDTRQKEFMNLAKCFKNH